MTVHTQRRIDRFAGVPLCLAAAVMHKAVDAITRRDRRTSPQTVLLIKFFGMGSLLLAVPFLRTLRDRFPHVRILVLTFAHNAEVTRYLPEVAAVMTISTENAAHFFRDTLRAYISIRREQVDTVFDLEFFSKFSTLLSAVSGARRRIGFALPTAWRSWNLTDAVPLDRDHHITAMYHRQLAAIGIHENVPPILPHVASTATERQSLEEKLRIVTPDSPLITVNVNAGSTSLERRWRPDNFRAVMERIAHQFPETVFVMTGSAQERPYVQHVIDDIPLHRIHNGAGILSLGEFVALLERSVVFITNDSGPMHLASSVGTPLVALFGPESPVFYGPLGIGTTLYAGIECSPCLNVYTAKHFVCPYNARCMDDITVEQVVDSVRTIVHRSVVKPDSSHAVA